MRFIPSTFISWPNKGRYMASYSSLKQDETTPSAENSNDDADENSKRGCFRMKYLLSLSVNVALLLLVIAIYFGGWPRQKETKLLASPIPDFPMEIRLFQLDPVYLSLPNPESTKAWEALPGPDGHGFINLEQSDAFEYPDSNVGLSVFHQLHCLGSIRHLMWEVVYGHVDTERLLRDWPDNVTSPSYDQATKGFWHVAHCFDYLRQGIQCAGDVSLEFASETGGLGLVDGMDNPHECRSWEAIWEFAEQHI